MVNTRKPPSVAAAPTSPETLLIGTEQAAGEAFGAGSAAGEFLRRRGSGPVEVVEVPGGGVALPRGSSLTVERIPLPEQRGAWAHLLLEHDPQRTPSLRCELDGEETPLEEVSPGVWRIPRGALVRGAPTGGDG